MPLSRDTFSDREITQALSNLPGWQKSENRHAITKQFVFRNFSEAFAFMTRSAMAAEKLDHHPEWYNVYKTVEVTLATHDANGITEFDIELARQMEKFASS